MTFEIKRTGNVDYGRYMKVLVCGNPGSGKTLFSSTFPNPLYISADPLFMSIAHKGIPYIHVHATDDLQNILADLEKPEGQREFIQGTVETVVIDTFDEIARMFGKERLLQTKKETLTQADWGWFADQLRGMIRNYRNLNMHVVFTCHLKESTDQDTGKMFIKPQIQGSVGDELAGYFDLAIIAKAGTTQAIVDGKNVRAMRRFLQTYPDPQSDWVKDHSGKLPQEFELRFTDDFDRMWTLIYGDLPSPEKSLTEMAEDLEVRTTAEKSAAEADGWTVVEDKAKSLPSSEEIAQLEADEAEMQKGYDEEWERIEREKAAANSEVEEEKPPTTNERLRSSLETPVKATKVEDLPKVEEKTPPPGVDPETGEIKSTFKCVDCDAEFTSEEQAELSTLRFRRVLCPSCHRKPGQKSGPGKNGAKAA